MTAERRSDDDSGFTAIVAYLPRDWPAQLRGAVASAIVDRSRIDEVLSLVDDWVLAATEDDTCT